MQIALEQAKIAFQENEVPVGAVVRIGDDLISVGRNSSIKSSDPTSHAEINALRAACETKQTSKLNNAVIYVTLEPCLMCAGALLNARIRGLVYGAQDTSSGAAGSIINVLESGWLNHRIDITSGVCSDKAAALLTVFFDNLRRNED
ncbi:MAG: tRNA-specific adenosine deaminase [Acidiferrobacteraceae bacterium]|nr:tRNA-specific adenosine deaminase [Acidiferrobacteraceae bacterium]